MKVLKLTTKATKLSPAFASFLVWFYGFVLFCSFFLNQVFFLYVGNLPSVRMCRWSAVQSNLSHAGWATHTLSLGAGSLSSSPGRNSIMNYNMFQAKWEIARFQHWLAQSGHSSIECWCWNWAASFLNLPSFQSATMQLKCHHDTKLPFPVSV